MVSDPYISVSSAAVWAETTDHEIRKRIGRGDIKALRVGRSVRLLESAVAASFGLALPGPRTLEIAREEAAQVRRRTAEEVPHWVYRMQDTDRELLYVGISNQGMRRLTQHAIEKSWWPQVATIEIEHFESRGEALAREAELIHEHRPPFNLAIPRRESA